MYLFLLGRDFKLSTIELFTYFKSKNIIYSVEKINNKYVILNFKVKPDFKKIINDLAGITRIAELLEINSNITSSFLNKLNYKSNKFNFTVSSIDLTFNQINKIIELLKDDFKQQKIKAIYKKPKKYKDGRSTIINPDNYFSWGLDSGLEIIIIKINKFYFFKTIYCINNKEFVYLDKNRPVQNKLYTTSFRLAKIMINILGLKKGDTLLDPFCGTGTFLMQGLLCNFNVIGSDKNKQMIDCARKNTKWVKTEFKLKNTFDIIIKDSRFLDFKADGVVFEPYMGKFLDKRPNPVYAKKLIKELEELYFDIFKNLSKYLKKNNKVVFIFPEFITFNEQKFNISQKVFLDNNFEILDSNKIDSNLNIKFPIDYETPSGSKLNRKIYVIVKK